MKILMTHFGTDAADGARRSLEAAGHQVIACDDAPLLHLACAALRGERCPLDAHAIDVAVHIQGGSGMAEAGTLCALRHFVPVVVASADDSGPADPFLPWATAVCSIDELGQTVVPASSAPLPVHSVAAQLAANAVLTSEGLPESWVACVRRHGADLRVELASDVNVPADLCGRAAIRAEGAIRLIDAVSPKIDIEISLPRTA